MGVRPAARNRSEASDTATTRNKTKAIAVFITRTNIRSGCKQAKLLEQVCGVTATWMESAGFVNQSGLDIRTASGGNTYFSGCLQPAAHGGGFTVSQRSSTDLEVP